MQIPIDF